MQQRSKSKWLQKAFVFLLAITIVATYSLPQSFGMFGAQTAKAAEQPVPVNDTYDGVDWEITADNVLKIGKEGETQTYTNRAARNAASWPWNSYRGQITKVEFAGKVIGQGCFEGIFEWLEVVNTIDLTNLETTNVTSLKDSFRECRRVKEINGIDGIDTSNATSMYAMFYGCNLLKLPEDLTNWDVSKVDNMLSVFKETAIEKIDITGWDTGNVKVMVFMFSQCRNLTEIKGIGSIDTSSVEEMHAMFENSPKLNITESLADWDLSKVGTAGADADVGGTNRMFQGTATEKLDITGWDTSNIKNMESMFANNPKLSEIKGIEDIDTGSVTDMAYMFYNCPKLELPEDLTGWDVSKVGTGGIDGAEGGMNEMFRKMPKIEKLDITGWDTSNVRNMAYMFRENSNLKEIKGIEDIDTGSVTDMGAMFYNCPKLELPEDLTGWDVSKVGTGGINKDQGSTFSLFNGTATEKLDITGWDTSNVISVVNMFANNPNLTEIKGVEDLNTGSVTGMYGVFNNCPKLKLPEDFTGWDVSKVGTGGANGDEGTMEAMFRGTATEKLDITGWDTSNVKSTNRMFSENPAITEIKGIKDLDTGSVTDMTNMFFNCPKLKLPEDLTGWDVSKVGTGGIYGDQGSTAGMFNITATEKLDITGWDISNVKDMNRMFQNNSNLETIKGLKGLDTSNVTEMEKVFNNCLKLKSLDINSWDVSKVGTGGIDANQGTMIYMFGSCQALKELDLSGWNTSNVRNMYGMFFGTNLETIDVTPLDTSSVVSMGLMFAENKNLTEIKGLENLDTSKVAYMENMFRNCPNLKDMDALFVEMTVSAEETNTHIMYENSSALVKATEDMLDKENLAKYTPATQALINTAIDDVKDAVWNGGEFTREKLKKMQDDIRAAAGQIVDDSYQDARDAFRDTIEGKEQKEADTAATKADSGIDAAQGSLNDAKAKAPQGGQVAIDAVKKAQTDAGKAVDDAKASKAAADEALKKAEERAAAMQRALDLAKAVGDQSKIDRAQRLKDDADQDLKDAQAAAEASEKAAEKAIEDAEKIKQEADKLAAEILADEAAKQADTAKKEADDAKKKAEDAKTSGDAQKAKDDAQKAKADADKAAKTAKDAQDAAKDALDGAKDDLNKAKDELLAAEKELEKAAKDLEDAIDSGTPEEIRAARAKLDEAEDKVDALKEKEKDAEDNVKECEDIAKKADDAAKKAAEAQKAAEDALKAADGALDKLKAKEELDKLLADAAKVDQSKYTPDTAKKFNDAINAGKKTSANPSSTPQQLNAAKDALNSAWRGLMPKDLDEARKNLDSKIGTAEKINQDIYTPATAKKLQDAILSGKKVLANPSATVAQINAASKAVDDAVAGLKKKPDSNKPVNLLTTSPVGKTVSALDSSLAKLKSDNDIKGSAFGLLKARGQAKGKNGLKLNWSKVKGASKYIVYGNKCGKYNSYKKLKTTKAKSFSPKKILKAKMKKNTYYKMMIVAVDKSNKVVAVSKTIHVATNGGKKGNDKSLKVTSPKNRKLSLKKGAGKKIKVKEVKAKKKKVARHRKVTFESSNPNVATVSSKGKVTAKAKGKATIYAYAQNGVYKTVNVTVK